MSKVSDLMGLGMPPRLANRLGNTPQNVTCAAGTTASGATLIAPMGYNVVLLTAASSTANSAVFSTAADVGTPIYVVNLVASAATASVYPPNVTGNTMNGTTLGSVLLTTGKTAIFLQTTANVWVSFPLAP